MAQHEYQDLSIDKLNMKLDELRHEHFNLRIQLGNGRLTKKDLLTKVRKNIARVITILTIKQVEK